MEEQPKQQHQKHGHRHLTPLEIITITEAIQRSEKVATLAKQFGVSRQTIYNAIQTINEGRIQPSPKNSPSPSLEKQPEPLSSKRKRIMRIVPETCLQLIGLKQKYPSWGIEYLRTRWLQMGNPPMAKSTMYKILKGANLLTAKSPETGHYERFEMMRPGQLYQMDIQGKIYLNGIGWVYGFAIIDDYSRYVPAIKYHSDMRISNAILTLNAAILQYGIPEAVYVDNGSQFTSRGERMNNFELFCKAYNIKVITSTPYRPQGKGKIERFFETLENQFIAEIKPKINESPGYTLNQLNQDLNTYLTSQYHVRVHGGTHEKPTDRFGQGTLRLPEPPIDVQQFLERTESRIVNKFREISFQGYKIQVDLVPGSKVTVVDMLETIRVEYQERLLREMNKNQLTKVVSINRQNGAFHSIPKEKSIQNSTISPGNNNIDEKSSLNNEKWGHKRDLEGFYHRMISNSGNFKIESLSYYLDPKRAGQSILIQVCENCIRIYDGHKTLLGTLDKRNGKKYTYAI